MKPKEEFYIRQIILTILYIFAVIVWTNVIFGKEKLFAIAGFTLVSTGIFVWVLNYLSSQYFKNGGDKLK